MSEHKALVRKIWQCQHKELGQTLYAFDTNPPTGTQQWAFLAALYQTGLNAVYSNSTPPEYQDWMVEGSMKQRLLILDLWDIEEGEYAVDTTIGNTDGQETGKENAL